jgi:DNA-binding transcriptional LysR family regulator
MELRELRAFVAVVEEGGFSAAARRLHLSQPALSQTVHSLERQLGVELLVRSRTGVTPTDAGTTLVTEARAVLARHDQAVAAVSRHSQPGGGMLRLGLPLELPPLLVGRVLAEFSAAWPDTRVQARHLSSAGQALALRGDQLDVALLRERPVGPDLDAALILQERLGVLLSAARALEVVGVDVAEEVRLEALSGLTWVGFPRSDSPSWFDEVSAVLRGHGVDPGPPATGDQPLIADVKLAAVQGGESFALAPPGWGQPLPDGVVWASLAGSPLVRRTWVVWPASSRRRDLAFLVSVFENHVPTPGSPGSAG